MIEYIEGDLFNSPAQVLVNTVNTVGVMGKGIALSFKKRYPGMFEAYRTACEKHQLVIGKLMLYYAPDHWILLFPTKMNWRNPSKIEYLEEGLKKFVNTYAEKRIMSIAFPKLGCGNGDLRWDDVRPIMEKYLKPLPITIYIYLGPDHSQPPEHTAQQETIEWMKENARDMSFDAVIEDLKLSAALLPYSFIVNGHRFEFAWSDHPTITQIGEESIILSEDEMFKAWDFIRNHGIVSIDENDKQASLFYALLCSKGYLSPVKVISHQYGEEKKSIGYQIHAGYGRAFAVQE